MNKFWTRTRQALTICFAVSSLAVASPLQAALLDGRSMSALLAHITEFGGTEIFVSSPAFVVGPGVELTGFGFRQNPPLPALVDVDVSGNQILITLLIDQPMAFREVLTFGDHQNNIPHFTSATVNPATNWAGFTPSHLSVSFERIDVTVSLLSGLQGQQILLDVVPEPASAGLALTAVGAAVAARGRRLRPRHR